jgi:hypothetical protein
MMNAAEIECTYACYAFEIGDKLGEIEVAVDHTASAGKHSTAVALNIVEGKLEKPNFGRRKGSVEQGNAEVDNPSVIVGNLLEGTESVAAYIQARSSHYCLVRTAGVDYSLLGLDLRFDVVRYFLDLLHHLCNPCRYCH